MHTTKTGTTMKTGLCTIHVDLYIFDGNCDAFNANIYSSSLQFNVLSCLSALTFIRKEMDSPITGMPKLPGGGAHGN